MGGIAIGPLRYFKKRDIAINRNSSTSPEEEWRRFLFACEEAKQKISELYEKALAEVGEENASIFEIHQMLLEDDDFTTSVKNMIYNQKATAEYATSSIGDQFSDMFAKMEDSYMQARAADVLDISHRITGILTENHETSQRSETPFILVAKDLSPSETIQLDKDLVLGFVIHNGSTNSHTAILARTMGIPALTGVDVEEDWDGYLGAIDGYNQCVYINPSADVLSDMEQKQRCDLQQKTLLQELRGQRSETLDGRRINIYANIGSVEDSKLAIENDAEGIGLFRSEFLYLDSKDFPSEEQQFLTYKKVVENMQGKKVIIRTLDIGADKQVSYFGLNKEENPALGYRAIRICLTHKEIFKTQLRAILRASAFGSVSIMFPMVISIQEVHQAKEILDECRRELQLQGKDIGDIEVGIMIETPAAVMIADDLAKEVDFFSLGTNDLTQYTLAIDRQNQMLERFYDTHHPAILKMIRHVVEAGHRNGCWVGICGELGADHTLTREFLLMGVDELSVSPTETLSLRKLIRSMDLGKTQ